MNDKETVKPQNNEPSENMYQELEDVHNSSPSISYIEMWRGLNVWLSMIVMWGYLCQTIFQESTTL